MGRDKAMLPLGGRTLLGRAVDTLRSVPALKDGTGGVSVTIVGERAELEGGDRAIVDRYPGCGPLGGMESALRDLSDNGDCEWAFFLPVDMPFLPAGLIDAVLHEWLQAGDKGARVCYVVVDGRAQPLVSMIHRSLHPFLVEALTAGQFKVTPVLQSAADVLASLHTDGIGCSHLVLHATPVILDGTGPAVVGWTATEEQEQWKRLWFSNLNNEEEFREAETFASSLGPS
jgi:molybdopterin-guanine dinucleotide biosynthesis protein A